MPDRRHAERMLIGSRVENERLCHGKKPMSEIDRYDYPLPKELIAQHPLPCRSDARLLVVERRPPRLRHAHVRDLPEHLQPGDALVLNDTRVVPARLLGYRERTGGRWSGLFVSVDEHGLWKVLGKTRGHLHAGEAIVLQDRQLRDAARLRLVASQDDGTWVACPEPEQPAWTLLERVGRVPLPPYIRGGEMTDEDVEHYQTVYATTPGAVAAPTAGLHFTERLLDELKQRKIHICRITLHVGPGTFRPVKTDRLADHSMHWEWGRVDDATVNRLLQVRSAGGRVVAVGTTSVRLLETAALSGTLQPWEGATDLFIRPPFTFRATDALMTNFHLPRSTLLVLVRTFGGDDLMRRAYEEAIREEYRFYSYGDAMLIL